MTFEFDEAKSNANKAKHGIDFLAAQALWKDPFVKEYPALVSNEPRFLAVGTIDKQIWTAVITYRGDNVRIISVRRARTREKQHYEKSSGHYG